MKLTPKFMPARAAVAALAALVIAALIGFTHTVGSAHSAPEPDGNTRQPILVELFTSEGCSDCPPADALLTELARTQPVAGAEIVPIEEHVDYFNTRAWSDPFSSHAYTLRQERYREAYSDSEIYTPQMIVQGGHGFVGSERDKALATVRQAVGQTDAGVKLSATRDAQGKLNVTVAADTNERANTVLVLALTQDNLSSDVEGGENAGRTLVHNAVARYMAPIGQLSGPGRVTAAQTITLNPQWPRGGLNLIAFLQDPRSRKILGVAAIPAP